MDDFNPRFEKFERSEDVQRAKCHRRAAQGPIRGVKSCHETGDVQIDVLWAFEAPTRASAAIELTRFERALESMVAHVTVDEGQKKSSLSYGWEVRTNEFVLRVRA